MSKLKGLGLKKKTKNWWNFAQIQTFFLSKLASISKIEMPRCATAGTEGWLTNLKRLGKIQRMKNLKL